MRRLDVSHVPYTLTIIDEYPYSVCEDFITRDTELVSAWYIMQAKKRDNSTSPYRHFLECCEGLGISNAREDLDKMLAVDFIIANEDRHFNNFGAVRNADTLKWVGLAPVFDCGTSLWYDRPTTMIRPLAEAPSKPFRKRHDDQIRLIGTFDWFDPAALQGIEAAFADILADSQFIDDARRNSLCHALLKRMELLTNHITGKRHVS
jgi:hypothetical protein